MKTFCSVVLGCAMISGFSQYYYVPSINGGTNPGGLNNDHEEALAYQNSQGTSWAQVLNTQPGAVWSTSKNLPFTFNFNGTNYTQFKASTTGLLTFTLSPGAAPSSVNAALPSGLVPDNSICVWGLDISGAGGQANDAVMSKTFGSAPNRQFWVTWASATDPSLSGTQYLYWSVVLEETSNKIYLVDQRTYAGGNNVSMTLGIQINSTTAVQVAGSPNVSSYTTATAQSENTPIDNTYYTFIPGTQPTNDAAMIAVTPVGTNAFAQAGSNITIGGTVQNLGSAAITAVDLKYSDGLNTYSDSRSGLTISSGDTYTFQHATPWTVQTGATNIDVWVELTGDADPSNDSMSLTVTGYTSLPVRRVVIEEATGTWCGWCPRGTVWMDNMSQQYPDAILIAVHNSDPMANAVYDGGLQPLIPGYPSIAVDRKSIIDPSQIVTGYNDHINDFGFAHLDIDASYNTSTRVCNAKVSAEFVVPMSGDYRLAVVFTEDDVTGTTSGYNQVNYYSYQSQNLPLVGAGKNWQQEPNPVPASSMEYDFVARTILGGFTGQAGSLPSTINPGVEYTHNFSYTIPASYDITKMKTIALLVDNSTGEVLNAQRLDGIWGNTGCIAPNVTTSGTTPLCHGDTVSAMVLASGTTPPYTYTWSNGQTTATATGLTAGTYIVTVMDADSCGAAASITITEPGPIAANATSTPDTIGASNCTGTVSASPSGGTPPYSMNWSSGTTTGLCAGSYSVTITDANNCTQVSSVAVDSVQATGVQSVIEAMPLMLTPNPAMDEVLLHDITRGARVRIYDITGHLMLEKFAVGGMDRVNVASWPEGVYHVTVHFDSGMSAARFVVSR